MNSMLDTCGSVAVLVSLRTTSPVAASATYRSKYSSPRDDRNAIHFPSGLIAGPTFMPVLCSLPLMTGRPAPDGGVVAARIRSYVWGMDAGHASESSFVSTPSTFLVTVFMSPAAPPVDNISGIRSSPYVPPTYAQNACPQRYGKYFGLSRSLMAGSRSCLAASRIHIAVLGSAGPSERYSAMPSMNQRGRRSAPFSPAGAPIGVVISN